MQRNLHEVFPFLGFSRAGIPLVKSQEGHWRKMSFGRLLHPLLQYVVVILPSLLKLINKSKLTSGEPALCALLTCPV